MKTMILFGVSLWLLMLVLWCSLRIIQGVRNYTEPEFLVGNEHYLPGNKMTGCYPSTFIGNDYYCILSHNASIYIYIVGSDIISTSFYFKAIPLGDLVVYYGNPKIVERYDGGIILIWDNLYVMVPRYYSLDTPVQIVTYKDMNLGE